MKRHTGVWEEEEEEGGSNIKYFSYRNLRAARAHTRQPSVSPVRSSHPDIVLVSTLLTPIRVFFRGGILWEEASTCPPTYPHRLPYYSCARTPHPLFPLVSPVRYIFSHEIELKK